MVGVSIICIWTQKLARLFKGSLINFQDWTQQFKLLLLNYWSMVFSWSLFPALVMEGYCFVKHYFFISKAAEIIYFCGGCLLKYKLSYIIATVGIIHSSLDVPMCSDYVCNYWNKCKKKKKMRTFFLKKNHHYGY